MNAHRRRGFKENSIGKKNHKNRTGRKDKRREMQNIVGDVAEEIKEGGRNKGLHYRT